ncbi:MAG: hypothetical protein WCK21_00240 [Actinomycetota bacterium]
MQDLRGRVAVITGGADGIGRTWARRCAAEERHGALADLTEKPA